MKWLSVKHCLPTDETKEYLVWAYPIPERYSPSTKLYGLDKTGTPKLARYSGGRVSHWLAGGFWDLLSNTSSCRWKVSHWSHVHSPLIKRKENK